MAEPLAATGRAAACPTVSPPAGRVAAAIWFMSPGVTEIQPLASLQGDARARMRLLGALYEACFCEPCGEPAVVTLLAAPGSQALVARRHTNCSVQTWGSSSSAMRPTKPKF